MHGVYIGNNQMLVKTVWGGMFVLPSTDRSVVPYLVADGMMEPSLTSYILKNIKAGFSVIDIGANLGYYTVLLAHRVGTAGTVHSFEANPSMISWINENTGLNFIAARVKLHNRAVYSKQGDLRLFVREKNCGNSSIHDIRDFHLDNNLDRTVEVTVPAVAIDDVFDQSAKIDFVKIDIEGGEFHAFTGMEQILAKGMVDSIAFEWNREMLAGDADPLYALLQKFRNDYNMDFFFIDANGNPVPVALGQIVQQPFNPAVLMKKRA